MPRPKRKRLMSVPPVIDGFKPFGVPIANSEPLVLLFEEYESIKLADYEGLTQEQAAEKMNISRPTFTRIYEKARRTIAQALVEAKIILIGSENEDIYTKNHWYRCRNCRHIATENKELEVEKCGNCSSKNLYRFRNLEH